MAGLIPVGSNQASAPLIPITDSGGSAPLLPLSDPGAVETVSTINDFTGITAGAISVTASNSEIGVPYVGLVNAGEAADAVGNGGTILGVIIDGYQVATNAKSLGGAALDLTVAGASWALGPEIGVPVSAGYMMVQHPSATTQMANAGITSLANSIIIYPF